MVRSVFHILAWAFLGAVSAAAWAQDPPPIRAYGELPRIEQASISPNGAITAIISYHNGERVLQFIRGGIIAQSVPIGDVKLRDVSWATDKLLLIDVSRTEKLGPNFTTDKAEFYKTLMVPVGEGKATWLFNNDKKIADTTYGWYGVRNINGQDYGYFGGVEKRRNVATGSTLATYVFVGGPPSLYRVNLSDFSTKKIAAAPSVDDYRRWLLGADDSIAATLNTRSSDGRWKITNSDDHVIASGESRFGYVSLVSLSYDGNSLIYYQKNEDEYTGYFQVPLAGGAIEAIFTDEEDIDRFFIDPATNRLQGYQRTNDKLDVKFFDLQREKLTKKIAPAFPGRLISLREWSKDKNIVIAKTSGNGDSGSWWTVDFANLRAEPLGFERPDIDNARVGPISRINFTAQDGLEMDGILTLPPGREPSNLPVIMFPHGGPNSEDEPEFDWWAQAMASRGYAVFQPNFRGSTNRDVEFLRAGYGEWGRKMQTDISDGMAHLAKQGIIDPKRACIVGASYGGYAALAGVTLQQGLYRCAVSVAGVSNVSLMVSTDAAESGSDPQLKRILQNEIGKGRELKEISPARFAENADAPILLIHGKDDVVVPFKQSTIMADALKDNGKPYKFVTLDEEDHWLSREVTRLKMLEETIAFIEQHNPPNAKTAAPAKENASTQ